MKCNLCRSSGLLPLIDFGSHPVVKPYLDDPGEDRPVWPVKLYFCETCGLTQLVDSCPADVLYENYVTLSSWKFQPHIQHEIDVIQSLAGITKDAKIVEIGSNDGLFLNALKQNGFEDLLGVEPAGDAFAQSMAAGIDTLNEFLTPELADSIAAQRGQFDLFLSRQNLEHISDLQGVAESIQTLVRPGGYVLIEVPNFACNLRSPDYSLWEEHVNYFTPETLRHFLSVAGVEMIHEEIILFSGESTFVIGRKESTVPSRMDYLPELRAQNLEYADTWPTFRSALGDFLTDRKKAGRKTAVYGAGARIFCLINFCGIASNIDVVVDDQEEKQRKYMPGGRIPIVASDALYSEEIDTCLLAVNTENEDKVIQRHAGWVASGGEFWSVLPPSDRLMPVWNVTVE